MSHRTMPETKASAGAFTLLVAALAVALPAGLAAQEGSPGLKSDWTFSFGAVAESNPFRLSDGQQAGFDADSPQFLDMRSVRDVGSLIAIEGDFRTRRSNGRRSRFGFEVEAELYARNSARTSFAADAFYAFEFSKRDEMRIEAAIDPGEFKKTYLVGYDGGGAPLFEAGDVSRRTVALGYSRELYDGRRTGLDLALEGRRRWRVVDGMPWRDRVETGAGGELSARLSKSLDVDLSVDWHAAEHDSAPEPFGGAMVLLNRDFVSLKIATTVGLDLSKSAKAYFDYALRNRTYDAGTTEDVRYGGRVDRRHEVGTRLRLEASKSIDVWLGGELRLQDSKRPALGPDLFEPDYRQSSVFLRLDYSR